MENNQPLLETLLTTAEAAHYLGISKSTLEKGRCSGNSGLPPYCKVKSAVRYRPSDLVKWLDDNITF